MGNNSSKVPMIELKKSNEGKKIEKSSFEKKKSNIKNRINEEKNN